MSCTCGEGTGHLDERGIKRAEHVGGYRCPVQCPCRGLWLGKIWACISLDPEAVLPSTGHDELVVTSLGWMRQDCDGKRDGMRCVAPRSTDSAVSRPQAAMHPGEARCGLP